MSNVVTYKIKAVISSLEPALDPVLDALQAAQVDGKTCYKVRLALDELLVNIISYAYDHENGEIEISYEITDNPRSVVIKVVDEGKAFNPLELEDPDITENAIDRKIGGLGVFIIKNTMDEIDYKRENNQNILTIKKYF